MSQRYSSWKILVQAVLPALCAVAIGWYFYKQLSNPILHELEFNHRMIWLIPVGLLYLVCQSIWGGFWITITRQQGVHLPLWIGYRGYFFSQFGKYVPGKIWVIILRTSMIGKLGANRVVVAFTSTYETLVSQASGALIGFSILPWILVPEDRVWSSWWFIPVAMMPLAVPGLRRLVIKIARKRRGKEGFDLPVIKLGTLVRGLLQDAVGWVLLGLALGLVIEAILPGRLQWDLFTLMQLTAANALAYVLGFIVLFMPAGGAIRELALQQLLIPLIVASGESVELAAGVSVVAAILLRLSWTIAEVIYALLLHQLIQPPTSIVGEVA
jgi:glycosyltransferase 2 family protein